MGYHNAISINIDLKAWEVVTFRRRTTPEPEGGYRLREEGPEWVVEAEPPQ